MGHKTAQGHAKSPWYGWKNARRALNSGERERRKRRKRKKRKRKRKGMRMRMRMRKSVRFLGNYLAPVGAKRCSRSPPHRMCQ
jgi:uncharacterized protein with von Willebrand factor type A (vWA) domain